MTNDEALVLFRRQAFEDRDDLLEALKILFDPKPSQEQRDQAYATYRRIEAGEPRPSG